MPLVTLALEIYPKYPYGLACVSTNPLIRQFVSVSDVALDADPALTPFTYSVITPDALTKAKCCHVFVILPDVENKVLLLITTKNPPLFSRNNVPAVLVLDVLLSNIPLRLDPVTSKEYAHVSNVKSPVPKANAELLGAVIVSPLPLKYPLHPVCEKGVNVP